MDIRKNLKEFVPLLTKAQEEQRTERDTEVLIIDFFRGVLGYDTADIFCEDRQKNNKFVDITLKVGGVIKFLVEVKAAREKLVERHIYQAEGYAVEAGYQWVVLTNGVTWKLYHVSIGTAEGEGVQHDEAFSCDLSQDNLDEAAQSLGLLHKLAIKDNELDPWWDKKTAVSPKQICRSLFRQETLAEIRRDIHKRCPLIDYDILADAIYGMLSDETQRKIGPRPHIRRKRGPRRSNDPKTLPPTPAIPNEELNTTAKAPSPTIEQAPIADTTPTTKTS